MTTLINDPRERSRFMRFAVVGIIGAVVDFGVMNILTGLAHMDLVPAGTISFICAVINNFTWNRYWTYPDSRTKSLLHQLSQFTVVSVTGLGIRIPILYYLEPVLLKPFTALGLPVFSPLFLAHNFTLAFAVLVVMFWNFFVNRYWTYSDVK